jgi:hypothetical protein
MLFTIPILLLIGALTSGTTFGVMLAISIVMIAYTAALFAVIGRERRLGHVNADVDRIFGARS